MNNHSNQNSSIATVKKKVNNSLPVKNQAVYFVLLQTLVLQMFKQLTMQHF